MTLVRTILVTLALPTALAAQTLPAFEVASIRPSAQQASQITAGVRITGSQVRVGAMTLKNYIGMAFRVKPQQIEGPDWMGQEQFDITATIPDGVPTTQVPEMFQQLLASRFGMQMHREMKELPVYVLGLGKSGLKLTEATPPADPTTDGKAAVNVTASGSGNGVNIDLGGGSSFSLGNNRLEIRYMRMLDIAEVLTRFVDRPVVDRTGITGRYDMTLQLTPEDYMAVLVRSALNNGVVIPPQALRALDNASSNPLAGPLGEAGLTLEARKTPLDVIVVDALTKAPTEN